jgi:carboxyl-terminal processing protease
VTILVGVSSLSFYTVEKAGLIRAVQSVCGWIDHEYVKRSEEPVQRFIKDCYKGARSDAELALSGRYGSDSRRALVTILNEKLSVLRVSHLAVYAPDETVAMWTGEGHRTGAKARIVDGELVISRVIDGTPAARGGVRQGDVLISIDGIPIMDPYEVELTSGVWEILKPDETRVNVPVYGEIIRDELEPYWSVKDEREDESRGHLRVLRVPSFLAQAFTGRAWESAQAEIASLRDREDRLILDLRGNPGGSVPAMLRLLGAVTCDRGLAGWIYRDQVPETNDYEKYRIKDRIEIDLQLERLERDGAIAIVPASSEACFKGRLGVLVDQGTGSVSEIFAQAIKERPRSVVAGWRTAGHVVLARWFQVAGLSRDFTVSVPIALYRSSKGEELERQGVSPDEILTDDLRRWRARRDPWIQDLSRLIESR